MRPTTLAQVSILIVTATALAACSSTPPPTSQLASTSAEIRAARELDGESLPDSQFYLKLATDQLTEASRLIRDGDNEKAARLLARADSDAELAVALAREAKTRDAATATLNQIQDLRRK